MSSRKTAIRTWLQLLRAPNLFTVPGDPLAGFLLASGGHPNAHLLGVILASLCFYGGGLLLNDLADLEEDRRERPNRPLPSGAADVRQVRIVTISLAVVALLPCALRGLGTFGVGLLLLAIIASYNLWAKRIAVVGPINMGLCRGLSFLLGAAAGLPSHAPLTALPSTAIVATITLTLYIALVTNLARIETQATPPRPPRMLPFFGLLLGIVPFFFLALDRGYLFAPLNVAIYAVSLYTLYAGFHIHRKLTREPAPPIPPMIGQLIRLLLPLQAIWCLASHSVTGGFAATLLLVLWPISRSVSRRFYAS